jgi:hypothetical protein
LAAAAKGIADIKTVLAMDEAQRCDALVWLADNHPRVFAELLSRSARRN